MHNQFTVKKCENLKVISLVRKRSIFMGPEDSVLCTLDPHLSQFIPFHAVIFCFPKIYLVIPSHLLLYLPSGLLPSGSVPQNAYVFCMRTTFVAYLLSYIFSVIIFYEFLQIINILVM
jgi:hypothetical protein